MTTHKIRTTLAAAAFGIAALGGVGYGIANATTSTAPPPASHHHSIATHSTDKPDRVDTPEPGDTPDNHGGADRPEPGDTPDNHGGVDTPEPGDTPDH